MDDALQWLTTSTASNDAILKQTARRAARVAQLGAYIGFADLIAYGWAHSVQIWMHFGTGAHMCLFEAFCPQHIFNLSKTWPELHMIGVRYGPNGSGVAWDLRDVNPVSYTHLRAHET